MKRYIYLLLLIVTLNIVIAADISTTDIVVKDNSLTYKDIEITPYTSTNVIYDKSLFDWYIENNSWGIIPKVELLKPINMSLRINTLKGNKVCVKVNPFYSYCTYEEVDFSDIITKNKDSKGSYSIKPIYAGEGDNIYIDYYLVNLYNVLDLDPSFKIVYTSSSQIIGNGSDYWRNQTEATAYGVRLYPTNTSGWFNSFVYYNSTGTYWNLSVRHNATVGNNITVHTRTSNNYNITDSGLVAMWALNGDATDELGIYDGVASITSYGNDNGIIGKGAFFDGGNDYLNIPDTTNLRFNDGDFTISAWIKHSSVGGAYRAILGKGSIGAGEFLLYSTYAGTCGAENNCLRFYSGSGTIDINPAIALNANQWYFVVVTRNSTGTYLYSNNQIIGSDTSDDVVISTTKNLTIGASNEGIERWFNGSIDEVRVYNRALSAEEVKNLYQLGSYHINWTGGEENWNDLGKVEDNVNIYPEGSSKFIQFRYLFETDDTDVSPYILNTTVEFNLSYTAPPVTYTSGTPLTMWRNYTTQNNVSWIDNNGNMFLWGYINVSSFWYNDNFYSVADFLVDSTDNESWNQSYANDLFLALDKNNWNGDSWITYTNPNFVFNESKLATIYYNATSGSIISGTYNDGSINDTQHPDGNYDEVSFNFTEQAAAPALDIRINFTDIDSFNQGVIRYKTSSLAGDFPLIQLWDYDDSAWEDYPSLMESTTYVIITQPVFDAASHVSGGIVQMRLYKPSTGNINNHYYVDWTALSKGYGTPAGQQAPESDPYWSANYTNMINHNCTGGVAIGIYPNGTFICETDDTGAGAGDFVYADWFDQWLNTTSNVIHDFFNATSIYLKDKIFFNNGTSSIYGIGGYGGKSGLVIEDNESLYLNVPQINSSYLKSCSYISTNSTGNLICNTTDITTDDDAGWTEVGSQTVTTNSVNISGDLMGSNCNDAKEATLNTEKGTIVSNTAMSIGNGQATYGVPVMCAGKVTTLVAMCSVATAANHVAFELRVNGASKVCDTAEVTVANTLYEATSCDIAIVRGNLVNCYSKTLTGTVTGCTCSLYIQYD